ncbi:unnamed protein product [Cylindrotheca closterium]|uniref:Uncharacterized protein n=1 Tax=Cylindrotheca closterium TaxID=2856 RepID=A0AAD2PUU4_9STRA|nr:unnamed protein product [Cylindrotheca closterium]
MRHCAFKPQNWDSFFETCLSIRIPLRVTSLLTRSKKAPSKGKGNETKKKAASNPATLAKPPPKQPGSLVYRKRYTAMIQGRAVRRTLNTKRMSIWVDDEDREHKEAVNVG